MIASQIPWRRGVIGPMTANGHKCVLLAERHYGLMEGVRGLLGTLFETVVMVSDDASLLAATPRLRPEVVIVDLSLARGGSVDWLKRLHLCLPDVKLVVLSDYDEKSVRRAVFDAGVDGFVLKQNVGSELLPAIEAVMAGQRFGAADASATQEP